MTLKGSDLLAKVKEVADASRSDLVRAAGYLSTKKDGSERLNFTAFYEALLESKGVTLREGGSNGKGKGGRRLSYVATVQGNGNLLVGYAISDGWITAAVLSRLDCLVTFDQDSVPLLPSRQAKTQRMEDVPDTGPCRACLEEAGQGQPRHLGGTGH
jgi:hypothetical protein